MAGYWIVLKAMLGRRSVSITRASKHPTAQYLRRHGLACVIREHLNLARPDQLPHQWVLHLPDVFVRPWRLNHRDVPLYLWHHTNYTPVALRAGVKLRADRRRLGPMDLAEHHLRLVHLGLPLHCELLRLHRRKAYRPTLATPRRNNFGLQQMKPLGHGRLAALRRKRDDPVRASEHHRPRSDRQYSPMAKHNLRFFVPFAHRQ